MVRLEDLSRTKSYHSVLKFAYKRAVRDIGSWTDGGLAPGQLPRFNRNIKNMDDREIKERIRDIHTFLQAPTSTLGGINKYYKESAVGLSKYIDKQLGNPEGTTNLTWQDLAKLDFGDLKEKNKDYGYQTMTMTIGKAIESVKALDKRIKSKKGITAQLEKIFKDTPQEQMFKKLLEDGLDVTLLRKMG